MSLEDPQTEGSGVEMSRGDKFITAGLALIAVAFILYLLIAFVTLDPQWVTRPEYFGARGFAAHVWVCAGIWLSIWAAK